MLLELPSLPEVPAADSVVQPSRPQFGAVVGDVDAARPVCVALELPAERRCTNTLQTLHPVCFFVSFFLLEVSEQIYLNPSLPVASTAFTPPTPNSPVSPLPPLLTTVFPSIPLSPTK